MIASKPEAPQASAGPTRYVVLLHTGYGPPHFDLMIELRPGDERLMTWRTPAWPLENGIRLTPLGPHRRAFLDYEGPISGGRGDVRRVAEGTCRVLAPGNVVRVRFDDDQLGEWLLAEEAQRP